MLRHAKSDWSRSSVQDYDHPLSGRGILDATGIGQWLKNHDHAPDYVISSPALRAWQTSEAVSYSLGVSAQNVHYDRNIYMADRDSLLKILASISADYRCVLLEGHNPGLDELLIYLAADKLKLSRNDKLLTTAAVAILLIPDEWNNLSAHSASLIKIMRPKKL